MTAPDNRLPVYGEPHRMTPAQLVNFERRTGRAAPPSFVRVVSWPNAQWQCQRHDWSAGSRTWDPWQSLRRPTTFEHAVWCLAEAEAEERRRVPRTVEAAA
jgi:hypothetical protein